ncbi:hypothetical protein AA15669_1472 [Saccharibacter floricola DSM 15669]|uniref:Uncharacterized protein n=1 Tax=Saccharibacter floricola DSM 15669 TaxID=1123227 RepID=A0ABQ0NZU3_9PROT|nr:hypothetical protein AA15669_1472 [Saccharibacter floricola DSM 15669]
MLLCPDKACHAKAEQNHRDGQRPDKTSSVLMANEAEKSENNKSDLS